MSAIIDNNLFLDAWKEDMTKTIQHMHPEYSTDKIEKTLNKMIKKQMQVPKVIMDNNYTGERRDTNLLSVLNWVVGSEPIIAGNATFYKNQHQAINPIAIMLSGFLDNRNAVKKRMLKVQESDPELAETLERSQKNLKQLANSYYGGAGMSQSAFYSLWSGPAITGSAQSVISTTETMFESFLVNNYYFIDINECFHYMNTILDSFDYIDDWVVPVTLKEVETRIKKMFYLDEWKSKWDGMLHDYLSNLSQDELTFIFYKNNLIEFCRRHKRVHQLFDTIFRNVQNLHIAESLDDIPREDYVNLKSSKDKDKLLEYNGRIFHEYFMDPNSPPDSIMETLEELNGDIIKYVYHNYLVIDRIHRLKHFLRKTVCIVDTDSNILALDQWVEFCQNELLRGDYGRSDELNKFIIINTVTFFITSAVKQVLELYGERSNIPEDFRGKLNMKNELYQQKMIIGKKKKRYISAIKLREGYLLEPYKPDVKGFEFMKSSTSKEAKDRFDRILKDHVFEKEIPDIPAILGELRQFEMDIQQSILRGETTYLPMAKAKGFDAFKNPYSQQSYRGMVAWNALYPTNAIEPPSAVSLLKLNIFVEDDLVGLEKTYPHIYTILKDEIFGSTDKNIVAKGVQVLAIPSSATIPEWCNDYIDYSTVINTIIGQFKGVLDTFGIDCPDVGKQKHGVNRKSKKFTNIINF